jgi:hypothetical protein
MNERTIGPARINLKIDNARRRGRSGDRDILVMIAASCVFWFAASRISVKVRQGNTLSSQAPANGSIQVIDRRFADRANLICRRMDSANPAARLIAMTEQSQMKDGRTIHTISIECLSAKGEHLATLVWDERSGDLITLGCTASQPNHGPSHGLTRDGAVRAAWTWMRAAGVTDRSELWQLDKTHESGTNQWHVWFVSGERTAFVQLNKWTGRPYIVRVYRKSPC